jgi:hypothetical protein
MKKIVKIIIPLFIMIFVIPVLSFSESNNVIVCSPLIAKCENPIPIYSEDKIKPYADESTIKEPTTYLTFNLFNKKKPPNYNKPQILKRTKKKSLWKKFKTWFSSKTRFLHPQKRKHQASAWGNVHKIKRARGSNLSP